MSIQVGVNGIKKIKNVYIGATNVGTKKVLKAYVGDANGVPKLFYKSSVKVSKTDNFCDKNELVRKKFPVCGMCGSGLSAGVREDEYKYFAYEFSKNIPANAQNINVSLVVSDTFGAEVAIVFRIPHDGFEMYQAYEWTNKYVTTISHNIGNNPNGYYLGFGFAFKGGQDNASATVKSITLEYEIES